MAGFQGLSNQIESTFTPGTRSLPEHRQVRNWPMPEIELHVPVAASEIGGGQPWPPTRAQAAAVRIRLYRRLWQGDLTHFAMDRAAVSLVPNFFARLASFMSELTTRPLDSHSPLAASAAGVITDLVRYGCLLYTSPSPRDS